MKTVNGHPPPDVQSVMETAAVAMQEQQTRALKAGEKLAKMNTTYSKAKLRWWRTYNVLTWILCGVAVAGGLRLLGIYVR